MSEQFTVQSYNSNTMFRVTHKESGLYRTGIMYSGQPGNEQIAQMMDEIEQELATKSGTVCFADALKAVIEEGKEITIDPESIGEDPDAEPWFTVELYQPIDPDMQPYLVLKQQAGMWPWAPDQAALFATWKILD